MALTIPAIASAEVKSKQITEGEVRVTYNASDTATNYGRVELERQIRRAAKDVCGPQNLRRAGSLGQLMDNRNCYEKAVADALKSISATA